MTAAVGLQTSATDERFVLPVEPREILTVDFSLFWKARLATEGDRRFVYFEASNESFDSQSERILKSALLDSQDLYLRVGNIDLEHVTLLGHLMGIKNPREYELGRPVEVRDSPAGIFVKGEIYRHADAVSGAGLWAEWFWMTRQLQPPMPWFASVGGLPKARHPFYDSEAKAHRTVITKAFWVNTALAREPVNLSVEGVTTVACGPFAKAVAYALARPECVGADGVPCACDVPGAAPVAKSTLAAGYGTDMASLSGGGALRLSSIERGVSNEAVQAAQTRWIEQLGTDACAHTGRQNRLTRQAMIEHFAQCESLDEDTARAAADTLLGHVQSRHRAAA